MGDPWVLENTSNSHEDSGNIQYKKNCLTNYNNMMLTNIRLCKILDNFKYLHAHKFKKQT